jgi:VWFA-related protein
MTNPMIRLAARSAVACAFLVGSSGASTAQSPASPMDVRLRFVEPASGQPLFGAIEVRLELEGDAAGSVDRVEVYFDGRAVGTLRRPPYLLRIDAGTSGSEHRLEAAAYAGARAVANATVSTTGVRIDEEIDVRLRQALVTVVRDGVAVRGLDRDDFTVTEGGTERTIETFAAGDQPFTAAFLVDASSSMKGDALGGALRAARSLVGTLDPLDEAKLMLFDDLLRGETPFTNVPAVLSLGLYDVRAGGGTAVNDTLWIAAHRLLNRGGRRVIVLLSDGLDVESVLPISAVRDVVLDGRIQLHWLRIESTRPGAVAPTDRNVKIYTLWRSPVGHRQELEGLDELAKASGGSVRTIRNLTEVDGALAELVAELRGQYALGYAVPESSSDRATPKIKVRGGGEVKIRTLEGRRQR